MGEMFAPLTAIEAQIAAPRRMPTRTPVVPVPADAPPMTFKHPKLGTPTKVWEYQTKDGGLAGYVCRWDFIDEHHNRTKEILPVTYCDLGDGKRAWRSKGMPSPRPLLALPAILANPDAPILVCEGEKTRDAAQLLFPDLLATTPAHGAKSPHLTDFGPCLGRVVIIATDFDEPGRKNDRDKPLHPGRDFGDKVHELAKAAGASQILHLRPEQLGSWSLVGGERIRRAAAIPDGWDLADALDEGWTAEAVRNLRDDPAFLSPYMGAATFTATPALVAGEGELQATPLPEGPFRVVWNGVEKRIDHVNRETGAVTFQWKWFCSLLEVAADTRSADGDEWGRLLLITDRDGRAKEWAMPMSLLAGDGTSYRERLLSLGMTMAPGKFARDCLHEYIVTARPGVKARCVLRTGWQSRTYVGIDQNFGAM